MKRTIDKAVDFFLAMLILGMTAVIFISVFFRYALNAPLSWSEEIARLMVVWMCFVGCYMALRDKKHIGFDLLFKHLPAGAKRGVDLFNQILMGIFTLVLIWQGLIFASQFLEVTMPYTNIPVGWFAYSVFPVSGLLMLWQIVLNIVQDARGAKPGKE
jgi:TRAP-type C4-dicarboxylate transport system permease small subunit